MIFVLIIHIRKARLRDDVFSLFFLFESEKAKERIPAFTKLFALKTKEVEKSQAVTGADDVLGKKSFLLNN